ncbi:DUF1707 domain-containing protein [Actinomadura adrarensis]|uniref:DUF1707 domain-containing protein n=1 Tax=Actinomadura adrarensis TaxID=1819600 RepID=A0ABW3C9B1_9ACTN
MREHTPVQRTRHVIATVFLGAGCVIAAGPTVLKWLATDVHIPAVVLLFLAGLVPLQAWALYYGYCSRDELRTRLDALQRLNAPRSRPSLYELRTGSAPSQRIGDAERDQVAELLRENHAAGRLNHDEFMERLDAAVSAVYLRDLTGLFNDLPTHI